MKLLRAVVVVLFLLGIEVYGAAWIGDRLNRDQTIPEITSDREMLEVPSAYTEDMLLEGLSAYDGLDGDLTDQIVHIIQLSLIKGMGLRIVASLAVMRTSLCPEHHPYARPIHDAVALQVRSQTDLLRHA